MLEGIYNYSVEIEFDVMYCAKPVLLLKFFPCGKLRESLSEVNV